MKFRLGTHDELLKKYPQHNDSGVASEDGDDHSREEVVEWMRIHSKKEKDSSSMSPSSSRRLKVIFVPLSLKSFATPKGDDAVPVACM